MVRDRDNRPAWELPEIRMQALSIKVANDFMRKALRTMGAKSGLAARRNLERGSPNVSRCVSPHDFEH